MNLRDLTYLCAVADQLHFGRAAEVSNVSQPTLSGQIRKLEEFLGVALFERDSRNVALTAAGEAVVSEARAVLAHAATIRDIARAHRDPLSGSFRLGAIATLGPFIVPDLLVRLEHDAPRLELAFTESLTASLLAALRAHTLDAALLATPPDGDDLTEIGLFDEPFLIAHAVNHPLAARRRLTLQDIAQGSLLLLAEGHCLRDQALAICGAAAVDMRFNAASLFTLIAIVAQGQGTTLVPALAARSAEALTLRKPEDETPKRQIRLVARRSYPRTGALAVVANAARGVAKANGLDCLAS